MTNCHSIGFFLKDIHHNLFVINSYDVFISNKNVAKMFYNWHEYCSIIGYVEPSAFGSYLLIEYS